MTARVPVIADEGPGDGFVQPVEDAHASFGPMLAGVAWMLAHELDRDALGGFTAARVIELFCAESIRANQRATGAEHAGWFKGLADPRVSEAIRCIHAAPNERWTACRQREGAKESEHGGGHALRRGLHAAGTRYPKR